MKDSSKKIVFEILSNTDIHIDGKKDCDIQVLDQKFYDMIVLDGSLGLGESYMQGMWECKDIPKMIDKLIRLKTEDLLSYKSKINIGLIHSKQRLKKTFNAQSIKMAKKNVEKHYDIGNELYEAMLDKRMTYTCGYWKNSNNLDSAQEAKLDLICKKLGLKKGDRLLDIGCGWGSLMIYAAEKYGVICDGLTLSREQKKYGEKIVQKKRLDVSFILKDYREFKPTKKYDHIASIGMFEHVGLENYQEFFECSSSLLSDNGIFLLHTIGSQISTLDTDKWINKYIFPNGKIPSMSQISNNIEHIFNIEDIHNFGPDYDTTLCAWFKKFDSAYRRKEIILTKENYRKWKYYLLSCAGAFRSRKLNLWQIVLTKPGRILPDTVRLT